MTLGDKLKALREVRGWSQHELSRHAGVRQALISELESGKKQETTTSVLRRLARTLHVSMDYLGGMYNGEPTHRCQVCLVGYLVVALAVPWVLAKLPCARSAETSGGPELRVTRLTTPPSAPAP